ncbi:MULTISPECIES: hypothetical protein [Micrococcaceae]|uniref:hypothetical protein n=1 Tax=Micrococcaceae TaxID=1268 RepID=UPI0012FAF9F6|nr:MULTISPECIES: hypothetical protein [Micrococcaceae]
MRDMISSLLRRWYVIAALLLLTVGLCLVVKQSFPSTYRAHASLVLMPPTSTVGPEGNPFLFLTGMGQILDILAVEVSTADTAPPFGQLYPGMSFVTEPDRGSSGSIIRVTVEGDDPSQVIPALEDVVALVPKTLTAMQDEQRVPTPSRVGLMTLVMDETPTEDAKSKSLSVATAAAGGFALSILLTGFIDGRMLARDERRGAPVKDGSASDLRTLRRARNHKHVDAAVPGPGTRTPPAIPPVEDRLTVDAKG